MRRVKELVIRVFWGKIEGVGDEGEGKGGVYAEATGVAPAFVTVGECYGGCAKRSGKDNQAHLER